MQLRNGAVGCALRVAQTLCLAVLRSCKLEELHVVQGTAIKGKEGRTRARAKEKAHRGRVRLTGRMSQGTGVCSVDLFGVEAKCMQDEEWRLSASAL